MGDSSFTTRSVKAARKPHVCEQCGKGIAIGDPYRRVSGVWEGDFYTQALHGECLDAGNLYALEHGLAADEWPWFAQMNLEREDRTWLLEHFPIVAERLGIKGAHDA
ncbi:hypothetical protein [uncultured Alsobacter sp.]|uniref:hypothetical protein n=1 Tax=uncultured Alsobacter sp. TaxID=1748258 RepID=UPI0025CBBC57|nr:hypothetical protein [uncultured Alsobacter sp.]